MGREKEEVSLERSTPQWLGVCHAGDCRQIMAAWPSGVADAAVTDPPYGDTSLEWDRRCEGWIVQVARVLKPASSIWVFGSMRFLVTLFDEMEAHGFKYAQDIVWQKQNGTGFQNDRFRRVRGEGSGGLVGDVLAHRFYSNMPTTVFPGT